MENIGLIVTSTITVSLEVVLAIMLLKFSKIGGAGNKAVTIGGIFIAILFAYLLATLPSGNLLPSMSGILYFVVILVVVSIFGALLFFSPIGKALDSLSHEYLLAAQGLRALFGANFIAQAGLGLMPLGAGLLHGGMHVGTGVFSLFAAILFLKKSNYAKHAIIFANVFGLSDVLITAIDISFISFNEMGVDHSMNFAVFFAAPVYMLLHLVALKNAWAIPNDKNRNG